MQRDQDIQMHQSRDFSTPVRLFLQERSGASLYEFALVACFIAVISIILLVALNLGP